MLEASPYYYYASLIIAIVCGAIFGVGFPAVYRSLVGAPQSCAEHDADRKEQKSNVQKCGASHSNTQLKGELELPSASTTIRKAERWPSVQNHFAAAPPQNFEGSSVMLRCSQGGASSSPISSNSPAAAVGLSTTCRLLIVGPSATTTDTLRVSDETAGSGVANMDHREGGDKERLNAVVEGAFIRLVLVSRTLALYAVQEEDESVRRSKLAAEDELKIGSAQATAHVANSSRSIKTGFHDTPLEAKAEKLSTTGKGRDGEGHFRRPAGRHLLPTDTFIGRITLSSTRLSSITLVVPREEGGDEVHAANRGYGVVLKVREEGSQGGGGLLDTLSASRRGGATAPLQQPSSVQAWRECHFSFETYREACRWYNALHDTLMNSSNGGGAENREGKEEEERAMWVEALDRFINASSAVLGEQSSDLTCIPPCATSSVAAALATRILFGTNEDSCHGDCSEPIATAFAKSFNRYAGQSLTSQQRVFDTHSQESDETATKKVMPTTSTFLLDGGAKAVTDDPLLVVLPTYMKRRLCNEVQRLAGASQSSDDREGEESNTNESNVIAAIRLIKMKACGRGSQSLARQYGLTQPTGGEELVTHACVPSARFYELKRQEEKDDISCPTTNTEKSIKKYRQCGGDDEQDEKFFTVAPSVREVSFDLGIASVASHPFIELIVKVFLYNSSLSDSNSTRRCDGENTEEEPLFSEPLYAYVKLEDLDGIVRTNIGSPAVSDGDAYYEMKRLPTPELWFGFCGRPAATVTCELISPATHPLVYRDVGSLDDKGIGRALSAYEQAVTLLAAVTKEGPLSSLESRIADEVFEALFAEVTLPHYGSLPMPTSVSAQRMGSDSASTSIAAKAQKQTLELTEVWAKETLKLIGAFTEAQSCLHYARCEALYVEAARCSSSALATLQKGSIAATLQEHSSSSMGPAQTISSTQPPHQALVVHASLSSPPPIELNKTPLSSSASASDLVQNLRRREESLRLALAEAKAAAAREHARRLEEAAKNDERRKAEAQKNQERMTELEKRLQQEREKESVRKQQQLQSPHEQCAHARESSVESGGIVARKLLLASQQRATDDEEMSAAVKPPAAPAPLIDEMTATRIQNTERAITLLSETLQKLADRPPPLPAAVPIVTYSPALTPRYRHKSKGSGRPQSRLRGRHRAASPSSHSSSLSSCSSSSSSNREEEEDGGAKGADSSIGEDSDAAVDHFELSTPKSSHRRSTKEDHSRKDNRKRKEKRKQEQNAKSKNNTPTLTAKGSLRKSVSPSASSSRIKERKEQGGGDKQNRGTMADGNESEGDAENITSTQRPPPTVLLDEAAAKQLLLSLHQEQREKEEANRRALREKAEKEEEERAMRVKRRQQLEEEERREKELVWMRERERVREEKKERAQRVLESTIQQLEDRLGREIAASRRREEEEDAKHRRREAELAAQIKVMQEQQNELQKAIESTNALGDHVRDREHQLQQTEASLKALQANLQEERNEQSSLIKQRLAEEEARRSREELLKKELELKAKADAERLELTRKELEELKERTIAAQAMAEERRRAEEAEKAKAKESEQEAQARLKEAEDAIISLQAQIIRSQTPPSSVSVASLSMVPPSHNSHDIMGRRSMGSSTTPRRHSSRVRVPSSHSNSGGLGLGRNAVASSPYDSYSSPVLDASVDNSNNNDNIDLLNTEYYSRPESVYASSVASPRGHFVLSSAFAGGGSSVPPYLQQNQHAYGTPPLTPRTSRQLANNKNNTNSAKVSSGNDTNEPKDSKSRRSHNTTIDNESVVEGGRGEKGEGIPDIKTPRKTAPQRSHRKAKLRTDGEGSNEEDAPDAADDKYVSTEEEEEQSDYEYQRHEYVGRDPSVPRTIDGFMATEATGKESASPTFGFMQNHLCKVLGGAIVGNRLDVERITTPPAPYSSSEVEKEKKGKESAIANTSSTTKACLLEVDDMLLSCNGVPLHTLSQLYEATISAGSRDDDHHVLVLSCFRDGDVVDVEIAVTS